MDNETRALYFRFFNEIGIISQLSRTMMDMRLPEGVNTSHFSVLNHLIRVQDGRTPLALARAFQVPKTTMTHTLAGLEKLGFVAAGETELFGAARGEKYPCIRYAKGIEPDLALKLAAH